MCVRNRKCNHVSDNWVVSTLESALETWNDKLTEIWALVAQTPESFRGGEIWNASSQEDRRSIFRSYGAVLNSLPTDATAKITIINRRLNPVNFQRTMLMPECGDGLDYYRGEYNQIILDKAAESNNLVQEKYITLSNEARKIEQTRAYFRRVDTNLSASFGRLDSGAYPISCAERLRLLHDFFRPGEEASFRFDLSANIRRGIDFRDLICPDGLQFKAGHLEMGGKFGRVLFMRDYASFISDEMIKDLSIHPNRLYPFCRSRLLRTYPQPQRITAHRYSYQLRNNHVGAARTAAGSTDKSATSHPGKNKS